MDKDLSKAVIKVFVELYNKKLIYKDKKLVNWDTNLQTAISDLEVVQKDVQSQLYYISYKIDNTDDSIVIATTRPELLPACVAVFYHPDDKRYQKYNGKFASVPSFGFKVPILSDKRVDPEKGTGIVMCCTFGDQTDMEWQKAYF